MILKKINELDQQEEILSRHLRQAHVIPAMSSHFILEATHGNVNTHTIITETPAISDTIATT